MTEVTSTPAEALDSGNATVLQLVPVFCAWCDKPVVPGDAGEAVEPCPDPEGHIRSDAMSEETWRRRAQS